jgi:transcriptional regulator with XRE-family HTH domain
MGVISMVCAVKVRFVEDREVPGLGAAIKAARVADGRSVRELADAAGISRGYWYDVENEDVRASIPADTLRAIEAVLGVTLLEGE